MVRFTTRAGPNGGQGVGDMMRRLIAVLSVLVLLGCGTSGSGEATPATDAPTTEPSTTAEPTTTTEAPTTTAAPTTTTTPPATGQGIVWRSDIDSARVNNTDPAPTFEADGITATIDMVLAVEPDAPTDSGSDCRAALDYQPIQDGPEQCLYVQWRFDVAADLQVDEYSEEGLLSGGALITPGGKQLNSGSGASGFPGTKDNVFAYTFAYGSPGSTLKFTTGNNTMVYTTHTYVVPPAESFQPVTF